MKAPIVPDSKVAELYGLPTYVQADWRTVAAAQECPFLNRKCLKNRKSSPEITIGSCTMTQGRETRPVMICPYRLIEGSQVFLDCIHLLRSHEPGNELRIITALTVPGGSVDYCLVSVREGKPRDFVGHKIATFDHLSKRLVLVLQDCLLSYMRAAFAFDHIQGVRDGDPMHFHAYEPRREPAAYRLQLAERVSTDSLGIARCLGLQAEPKVELQSILDQIAAKLPQSRRLEVVSGAAPPPTPTLAPAVSDE